MNNINNLTTYNVKNMGKKIRNQANNLGLTKLRKTSLYAQAKNTRMMAVAHAPDAADAIRNYLKPLVYYLF